MTDIRSLCKEEIKDAVRLADLVFRASDQPSMGPAFPNIFSSHLIGQSYGAFDNGELVSFLGVVPSIAQVGPARLKTYSLGSVCTHPDYRGKGYAGEILKQVIRHVDQAGASLLLVSGSLSLYRRENCHPFGSVQRFSLDPTSAQAVLAHDSSSDVSFRELESTDWLRLVELARLKEVRFEQSVWDLSSLIEAEAFASVNKQHHKVFIAQRDNQLVGFVVLGVPYVQKERPVVYEWGGDGATVSALMAYAVEQLQLSGLDVPVSWYDESMLQGLETLPSTKEKNLGTVKIIQPERLIEQLRPYFETKDAKLNSQFDARSLEEGQVRLQVRGDNVILSSEEFVSLVFDLESEHDLNNRLNGSVSTLFPIPFPYTGGLNYV